MRRIMAIAVMVGVLASGPAWGGEVTTYVTSYMGKCKKFLGAYAGMKLIGGSTYEGDHDVFLNRGYILGYLTAYNAYKRDKGTILGSMEMNDAFRWIASWCRDNPQKDLSYAMGALIKAQIKNRP